MAEPKVVLITGASSGFGRATAELLGERGHRVYGTSRRELPEGAGHRMLVLDVRSDESVRSCVGTVIEEAGRIDVLVNNAGYLLEGFLEETSVEEARALFETNVFGVARVTRAVLAAMRRQGSGRIINVGSLAGVVPPPGHGFYAASKFALEGYSEALRYEVERFGIDVSIVEPGFYRTGIHADAVVAEERIADYDPVRAGVTSVFREGAASGGDPREVAELIAKIIRAGSPRLRYRIGPGAGWVPIIRGLLPEWAFAIGMRRHFRLRG